MSSETKKLAIEEIAEYILGMNYDNFSKEAVDNAKDRIIDVIGCAISGANANGNSALLDSVRQWGGKKEATVFVHGDKVPVQYAAMINSIMCRSYDFEVCGPTAIGHESRMTGHICGTTDHVAISLSEFKKVSGKELITVAILGGDMAVRFTVTDVSNYGASMRAANAFGSTAIASKIMGLNKSQIINAFGIVLDRTYSPAQGMWDGNHSFKLSQGTMASDAIFAVELALRGFTGAKDPLFSHLGYFPVYCKEFNPSFLTENLGKVFHTKGQHKMRPSGFVNHSTIEAALKILNEHQINAEDIVEVILGVTQSTPGSFLGQPFIEGDTAERALFDLPYGAANTLLRKSTKIEHFTDEYVRDPKVIELAKKVKLVVKNPPGANMPPTRHHVFDLMVKMKDGQEYYVSVEKPKGYPGNELTREEIKDKYRYNVDYCKKISRNKSEKALAMLEELGKIDNISKIMELLVA